MEGALGLLLKQVARNVGGCRIQEAIWAADAIHLNYSSWQKHTSVSLWQLMSSWLALPPRAQVWLEAVASGVPAAAAAQAGL